MACCCSTTVGANKLIEQAEAILKEWTPWVTSVEVCSGTRVIYRSPEPLLPALDMAAD